MEKFTKVIILLVVCVTLLLVNALFFEWIWNANMPELFGLKEITLGNAVALLVMVGVVKNSVTSNFSLDKK